MKIKHKLNPASAKKKNCLLTCPAVSSFTRSLITIFRVIKIARALRLSSSEFEN